MTKWRYHMPAAERRTPWLRGLLDAYALTDASVERAVGGRKPACAKGCAVCCRQPIPATPPEAVGIVLFIGGVAPQMAEKALEGHRRNQAGSAECLFLHGGCCGVYPVRPIACRRYIVLGEPCAAGIDPATERLKDMALPDGESLAAALRLTAPYYAAHGPALPPEPRFKDFAALTGVLGSYDWPRLLRKIQPRPLPVRIFF